MSGTDDSKTGCDHDWGEGTDPAYLWCPKCGEYLSKEGIETITIFTPWIIEPIPATEK